MAESSRTWLVLTVSLLLAGAAAGQTPQLTDRPTPATPLRPPTRQELDRHEALRLYALALLQEHDSRLVEAVTTLEKARGLDPDSALLNRTLVQLYLALDRLDDALAVCRRALDLEPGDYETWALYARQLRLQGRNADAVAALEHALACPGSAEHPGLRLQVSFDLGALHENAQEFDKAEKAFALTAEVLDRPEALMEQAGLSREEVAAQAAEAYERLGKVCVRAQHFDRAVAAYRKAQEKDPTRAQRLDFNLAGVYLGQNKLTEALACLEEYLKTQPEETEAYELKIKVLEQLGRANDILPELKRAATQDAQNAHLKLLLARQCALRGQTRAAENIYQQLLTTSVGTDVYKGLFTLYRESARAGEVLDLLNDALRKAAGDKEQHQAGSATDAARAHTMLLVLREDSALVKGMLPAVRERLLDGDEHDPPFVRRKPTLSGATCGFLALLAARANQLDDAEKLYRSCLAQADEAGRGNEPAIYGGLLRVLWQEHKHQAIVDLCRAGLGKAQVTNRLLFELDLARALAILGQVDEALKEANNAVDIAGEDRLLALRNRALILAEARRKDQAIAECQAMLKEFSKPDDLQEVRYALSEVYSTFKEYPKAEEQLQLLLKDHPDEARAHNDLGYIWADQGKNLAEAEKLIRRAIELEAQQRQKGTHVDADSDPENGAYLDSLGWVLFRRGRLEEARRELEKAAALPDGADDPVVWDHLGDVYYRLKETARARRVWSKAITLYETTGRRQRDDRYRDIQQKRKLLEPAADQP